MEGRLLQFWVRYGKEKTVLVMGTGTGDSALAFAEALPQDGWWVTFEREQDAASLAVSIGGRVAPVWEDQFRGDPLISLSNHPWSGVEASFD